MRERGTKSPHKMYTEFEIMPSRGGPKQNIQMLKDIEQHFFGRS